MDPFPGQAVIQWAQQQLSQYGRLGATRIVRVPALAAVLPAPVGSLAQAPQVTWRDAGTVIALYAQERTGTTAKMAATEMRLQFSGDEDLITNGSAGDFAPFLALVGPNINWFPIVRRVRRGDNWVVTYRNQDPAAATADPTVAFAFIADADLGRYEREMREEKQQRG